MSWRRFDRARTDPSLFNTPLIVDFADSLPSCLGGWSSHQWRRSSGMLFGQKKTRVISQACVCTFAVRMIG